jgi:hypothetical protein
VYVLGNGPSMNWPDFILLYAALAAALALLFRRIFAGQWWRLSRVMAAAVSLGFFIDYPAEDRHIWRFAGTSRLYLLEVPVENLILMMASIIYILLIYLPLRNSPRFHNAQSRTPKA